MKSLLLSCLSISLVCIASGCASFFQSRSYSVAVENIGNKTIEVTQIELYQKSKSGMGGLFPEGVYAAGMGASYFPYWNIPYKEVTVKWRVVETGKEYSQRISIKIPKGFYNEEWLSRIIFYINPNKEKVWVVYDIFDEAKDAYVIVNSEGDPFTIDDYAEVE